MHATAIYGWLDLGFTFRVKKYILVCVDIIMHFVYVYSIQYV